MKYTSILQIIFLFYSCTTMKNSGRPEIADKGEGFYFKVRDGHRLFIYDFRPTENYKTTVYIISGITGINHHGEKDIIELLSNHENRVVVIHPRGTGYSDGTRGDISNFEDLINDYLEIISSDCCSDPPKHKIILFGHSMSTAMLLAIADKIPFVGGAILVNPPYIQKSAKGMSPGFFKYLKYAAYMILARHKPVVNMAGNPMLIENEDDRKESERRTNDPLLVKYFSMYYMNETRKLIRSMPAYCKNAGYPLLLIYGLADHIVDKKGCDIIYHEWKQPDKEYKLIENGPHGKSTVLLAKDVIIAWIKRHARE